MNCQNDKMTLSFGNLILKLNVFHLCKQPRDNNTDFEEEDFIDILAAESFEESINTHSYDSLNQVRT